MKRVLIALITALPLAVGVASAQASDFPGGGSDGGTSTPQAAVAGTIVAVDPTTGSFTANAYVLTPPSLGTGGSGFGGGGFGGGGFGFGGGGSGGTGGGMGGDARRSDVTTTPPTTTLVTITTDANTIITIGGMGDGITGGMSGDMSDDVATASTPTVADLVPGAKFMALFPGSPTDTIQTLVANPATEIFAQVPKQVYAFVGSVTATTPSTSTTPGSVTVDVTRSLPSGLIAGGTSATFTVDSGTFIIGGSSLSGSGFGDLFGGSLGSVSTGDLVAGGLIGDAGLTAAQVEASPLMFMLDLPAPTTGSTTTGAARKALNTTLTLLHGGKVKLSKHGKHGKHGKARHKAKSTKSTSHAGKH